MTEQQEDSMTAIAGATPAHTPIGTNPDGHDLIDARNLVKQYGSVSVVKDVSFSLSDGGSLGIVGESGSGKTTVARMLVGLTKPTSGTIACLGEDRSTPARSLRDRRRRGQQLQMVFQNPYQSLDRNQTVGAALREVLSVHDRRLDRIARSDRIAELLELVGLPSSYEGAFPSHLSGGLRQRVAIARAMAANPQGIILDEAVSALDVSIQAQIINLLNDVRAKTGVAYVFISHDLAVVRELTADVVVMCAGEIVERGRTADVLDKPRHSYTQRLCASFPVPGWTPKRAGASVDSA
jgi:ABC-type glutathione transport system ATPase component